MSLRTRNGAVLFGVESTPGTPETLTAGTHAVLVENPQINFNPQNVQTNEVTGSLDNRGPIVGGLQVSVTFDVYMKGSGSAGTAPEVGALLKCCGWSETVTATAVPATAEALGSGASQTAATLGASASGTAQAYRGMPVEFSTTVTGWSFITNYTTGKVATLTDDMGATLTTTTDYQIPVNVLYGPTSSSINAGTLELFQDGLKYKLTGCRGNMSVNLTAAGPGRFSFTFSGIMVSKTDVAVPSATYDSTRPPIWKNARSSLERVTAAIGTLTLDNGNTVVYPENPTATEGFDVSEITERGMSGNIDPAATLIATRDILTNMTAGTSGILLAGWGTAGGNRVGLTVPTALYTDDSPGDRQGIMTENIPYSAIGQDAGAFICFY